MVGLFSHLHQTDFYSNSRSEGAKREIFFSNRKITGVAAAAAAYRLRHGSKYKWATHFLVQPLVSQQFHSSFQTDPYYSWASLCPVVSAANL